jgi:hypothetical protein
VEPETVDRAVYKQIADVLRSRWRAGSLDRVRGCRLGGGSSRKASATGCPSLNAPRSGARRRPSPRSRRRGDGARRNAERGGTMLPTAMAKLEQELKDAMALDVEPIIEQIKAEGGGLEGLAKIIEQVVLPLLAGQKAAILRLACEVDKHRAAIAEFRAE